MIKIDMPNQAKTAIDALNSNGFEAFAVGGCVRDSLLGKNALDWDITTNALPGDIQRCFSGYKVIETGLKHGTLTVIADGLPLEITTYRVDGAYTDHRRPDAVMFTGNLDEDLSRRDFTVNAMAYHPGYGLIDRFGGMGDLEARRLVCVGDARTRFDEDALRILRAVRFSSVLGFEIEGKTKAAMEEKKSLLDFVSSERTSAELKKTLVGDNILGVLTAHTEVFTQIIPELAQTVGFNQHNKYHYHDVFLHTAHAVAAAPKDIVLKLAMLLHDVGKPSTFSLDENGTGHFYGHASAGAELAGAALYRLRFDNDTIKLVTYLIARHCDRIYPEPKSIKRALNKMGEKTLRLLIAVNRADCMARVPQFLDEQLKEIDAITSVLDEIIEQNGAFCLRDLAIDGSDLQKLGFQPGRKLGETLETLLNLVIDEKLENERESLSREAEKLL